MGFITVGLLEAQHTPLKELASAKVGGHDNHGVPEAGSAPLRILQAPVLQNLEQQVENIRVGFFHLVQQNDRIGPTAN